MPLAPGTRLGPYHILARVGAGGMGEVYRAHDPLRGRDVAIKVLPGSLAADVQFRARFEREAQAIASISHPNIVTIHSVETAAGIQFLTMELIEGVALNEMISAGGLPLDRVLSICIPLTEAVSAAHQKGITHRDLKPANVMVTANGQVKVLDFGLATGAAPLVGGRGDDETPARLAAGGVIVGTIPYMSPEQLDGRPIDSRSDLFSFGVMLHEMLTGAPPFTGPSAAALISAILCDAPPAIAKERADVPAALAQLVARCLEKRPDDRPQTAWDVSTELRRVQKELERGVRSAAPARSLT